MTPWYLVLSVMGHRGFRGMVSTSFPPPMCGGAAGIGVCSGVASLVGFGFPSCGIMAGQVPSLVVMVQGMGLSQAFALFCISAIASLSVAWVLVMPRRLVV